MDDFAKERRSKLRSRISFKRMEHATRFSSSGHSFSCRILNLSENGLCIEAHGQGKVNDEGVIVLKWGNRELFIPVHRVWSVESLQGQVMGLNSESGDLEPIFARYLKAMNRSEDRGIVV